VNTKHRGNGSIRAACSIKKNPERANEGNRRPKPSQNHFTPNPRKSRKTREPRQVDPQIGGRLRKSHWDGSYSREAAANDPTPQFYLGRAGFPKERTSEELRGKETGEGEKGQHSNDAERGKVEMEGLTILDPAHRSGTVDQRDPLAKGDGRRINLGKCPWSHQRIPTQ